MNGFAEALLARWARRPFLWPPVGDEDPPVPDGATVLALAPHPDDPESAALALGLLKSHGCSIHIAVVTDSPGGVQDLYARAHPVGGDGSLEDRKRAIRRAEQIRSAQSSGFDVSRVAFLGLDRDGELDREAGPGHLADHIAAVDPDIVILPIGRDTNRTHVWVYDSFREVALRRASDGRRVLVGMYNRDPKTISIRGDLFVLFGDEEARIKRGLLRLHDSQQQRNCRTRAAGFDDRILETDRSSAVRMHGATSRAPTEAEYAEIYELEVFESPC